MIGVGVGALEGVGVSEGCALTIIGVTATAAATLTPTATARAVPEAPVVWRCLINDHLTITVFRFGHV